MITASDERLDVLAVTARTARVDAIEALLREASGRPPRIHVAESYERGLELATSPEIDVCLVDQRLGSRSGLDFIRELTIRGARVPTIRLTGGDDPDGAMDPPEGQGAADSELAALQVVDHLEWSGLTGERLLRCIRHAMERRRRMRAEARLEALVGSARELVSIVGRDGSLRWISPSIRRVLGFRRDQKTEAEAILEVHPDDRPAVEAALTSVVEGQEQRVDLQYRVRHADGSWRWLDTTAESHLDDPDIDGVVVSSWDVTERVRAEESIRYQASLLAAVGQAVIATDLTGTIVHWNPAAERMYGWTRDEAVGMSILEVTPSAGSRARGGEIMERLVAGETWRGEFEVRRKDGSTFPVLISNSPVRDPNDDVIGVIGVSSDITSLKRTELELRDRVKELRTLNRAASLLHASGPPLETRLQELVEILPDGYARPECTEARLLLRGRTFTSGAFRETPWMHSVDLDLDDGAGGRIEVARTELEDESAEPFLGEEYEMLESLARMIAQAVDRASLTAILTQAFASLREAVFVVEADHEIRYANPAAERIFGYRADELVGRSTRMLYGDQETFRRFHEEGVVALQSEGVYSAAFPMRAKDGGIFDAEQTVTVLDSDRGLAAGVVSVVRDVSERSAAEAELRHSEERFRQIAEHIEDVFWISAPDLSEVEYVSPAFEAVWGRSLRERRENPEVWLDAIVPEDRERIAEAVTKLAEGPQMQEYRIARPDGEIRHILDRSFPVSDEDGVVTRILGVARDITEEKRLEQRFGILSREITDVIYVIAADGTVLTSSPSIQRATGYTREQFEGMDAMDLVHPDDRERVRQALEGVLDEPGRVGRADYRVVTRDGDVLQVDTVARNLISDPAVGGILITSRDVTERQELERRIRQMQKLESIGLLAGGVAHDFNNILTVIRSQADLVLMDAPDGALADDVAVIRDAADRAARLTRQLLAFSREQVLQPRVVDLGEVVRDTSGLIDRLLGERIRVTYDVGRGLPTARVDPGQVEQILMNLSINARDAMPEGGDLTISVRGADVDAEMAEPIPDLEPGRYVLIEVRDTGTGMSAETQQRIFEPFFTTKGKGRGTGLGLSMVYGTVGQSGGSVQVESAPGRGTTFRLFFPAIDAEPDRSAESGAAEEDVVGRAAGTILVVEDDPAVRRGAARVLTRAGFEVAEADTAEAALRLLEKEEIHLVLTDLMLGETTGYDLLGRLRELRPGLPVVVMSGWAEGSPGREGLPPGLPFVEKPFTPTRLVSAIRDVLRSIG